MHQANPPHLCVLFPSSFIMSLSMQSYCMQEYTYTAVIIGPGFWRLVNPLFALGSWSSDMPWVLAFRLLCISWLPPSFLTLAFEICEFFMKSFEWDTVKLSFFRSFHCCFVRQSGHYTESLLLYFPKPMASLLLTVRHNIAWLKNILPYAASCLVCQKYWSENATWCCKNAHDGLENAY